MHVENITRILMRVFGHHLGTCSDQITQTLQGVGMEVGSLNLDGKYLKTT